MEKVKEHKISLFAAILININVMIGSGVFVNTVVLAKNAGVYGAFLYALMGLLLLPLVFVFSRLLKIYDGGTFYDFVEPLHPVLGFIAGFSYFIAKLTSSAIGIYVFVSFIQEAFPVLGCIPSLYFTFLLVLVFVLLNLLNISAGKYIQYGFLFFKLIPILFIILCGVLFLKGDDFNFWDFSFLKVFGSLPLVLYAFTGFEVCCSLSKKLEHPRRDGSRVVWISYFIGIALGVLYQLMFYAVLREGLANVKSYVEAFPVFINFVMPGLYFLQRFFLVVLSVGIAVSALGSSYGIMYSNIWNLFRIVGTGRFPFAKVLKKLNRNQIPFFIVFIEGFVVLMYLFLFKGKVVPLQQVNTVGTTLMYFLCVVSLLVYCVKYLKKLLWLPVLALSSCVFLTLGFVENIKLYGSGPLILFLGVVLLGTLAFSLSCFAEDF